MMITDELTARPVAGQRGEMDVALRRRISGWLWHYKVLYAHEYPTDTAFARAIGISAATLSNALNHPDRSIGLDLLVKIRRGLSVSLDPIVDTDAPRQRQTPVPNQASPANATPGRRGRTGRV